ncbi:Mitogen-activated protein kinase kinase kinase MLK4 [Liparis tanakae]|uniref:Mitogen-activated protein kinase kinase kinase MLK4 n=1 Tax=Liparis tanakae TaxID=230148 RepID=A0A4Z2IQK4_9TELE|nr:Mitogen-activated protein kinase kinase kinase MLK4 [Liparis tanakae]
MPSGFPAMGITFDRHGFPDSNKTLVFVVTQDESNRTWGRSTPFRPEEFEDVKKGIKKKGRTWGPSSVQSKERPAAAERVRPLSDGSNPWSTSLVKCQKAVPLSALFAEQSPIDPSGICAHPPQLHKN